jgi:hypothetical protein
MKSEFCKCGRTKERRYAGQCNKCHSAYTKEWKKKNPLTPEQKEKDKQTRRKREAKRLEGIRKRSPRLGAKPGILRPLCSWCNEVIENFKKKNYCKSCAAKYNREWREKNPLSGELLLRHRVRNRTFYHIKAGNLIKKPCEICGDLKVHAHHDDYHKPLHVRWLCAKHHREFHDEEKRSNGTGGNNHKSINS